MANTLKSANVVPVSGLYLVPRSAHKVPAEITIAKRQVFPPLTSRRRLTAEERQCAQICLSAGAVHFFGIQRAFPEYGLEALCLFTGRLGSCLALPLSQLSIETVRRKLGLHDRDNKRVGDFVARLDSKS
jgi:hypothetical protein